MTPFLHRDAILNEADLRGADLDNTNFSGASLVGADLKGGLKMRYNNSLCSAKTIYMTKFDPEIKEKVMKDCPDLLKERHFPRKPERMIVK